MKNLIIIVCMFCVVFTKCFAQDNASRIQEIKKMYAEIIQFSNSNKSKECKTGKMMENTEDNNSHKYSMEQTATYCKVSKEYSTYQAKFAGHEWNADVSIYMKNNKIFFVLINNAAETTIDNYRLYYGVYDKVIKVLKTSNEGDDSITPESMKTIEIKNKAEMKSIVDEFDKDFKKILKMTK
jgi:hypothetical protein